jgi:hypothetical protein
MEFYIKSCIVLADDRKVFRWFLYFFTKQFPLPNHNSYDLSRVVWPLCSKFYDYLHIYTPLLNVYLGCAQNYVHDSNFRSNGKQVHMRHQVRGSGQKNLLIIHRRARRGEERRCFFFVINHNFLCLSGM